MMATRKWMDNAFWHNEEKEMAEAILLITDENNREISQVVTVRKFDINGDLNPDFTELLEQIGEEKIDENTKERQERKSKEKEIDEQRKKAEEQARELEKLFDAKIKILEIDQIKNTSNKTLKSKLRRSKNLVELNLYAQLIMMEELGIGFVTNEAAESK
jgi:thiamine pyrophosphate-dependent acetolactate synthase large subunit-like protein